MRLILNLPQEGIDAKVKAFDVEGKPIPTAVARLEIEPIFYQSNAVPIVLFGVVKGGKDGKTEAQRFSVGLSGTTGKCVLKSRPEPVKPKFDRPDQSETLPVEDPDPNDEDADLTGFKRAEGGSEDEQEYEADEEEQQDLVELPDSKDA